MAIRPVDVLIAMPKAMETSRTAAAENMRPAADQQQFAQHLQKTAAQQQQSVRETNQAEGQNVDKDGRGGSGGYNRRKKRQDEKKQEDESVQGAEGVGIRRRGLDISL